MGLGLTEIILLLVLLCVPIWLIAFVDILKNDFKENNKLIWLFCRNLRAFHRPAVLFFHWQEAEDRRQKSVKPAGGVIR